MHYNYPPYYCGPEPKNWNIHNSYSVPKDIRDGEWIVIKEHEWPGPCGPATVNLFVQPNEVNWSPGVEWIKIHELPKE